MEAAMLYRFLSWFFIVFIPFVVDAVPYNFISLISPDGKKKVELISDAHHRVQHIGNALEEADQKNSFLSEDEQALFTTTERAFLQIIPMLNKQEKVIRLLWEGNEESFTNAMEGRFIDHGGAKLFDFFKENDGRNEKIFFTSSDCYRANPDGWQQIWDAKKATNDPLKKAFSFIFELLEGNSSIVADLKQVDNDAIKEQLSTYWKNYCEKELNPIFSQTIKPVENMSMQEFMQTKQGQYLQKIFSDKISCPVMNYELLLKIFWPADQVIVYAGGRHCQEVAQELITNYGFKKTVEVGLGDAVSAPFYYAAPLNTNIWTKYLFDEKAVEGTSCLFGREKMDSFFSLVKQSNTKEQLEKLLSEASNAEIDLVNCQEVENYSQVNTAPLHCAIHSGDEEVVRLLLTYGADPNISDAKNNTPLHEAVRLGHKNLVAILLENNAYPFLENNQKEVPLDLAEDAGIIELLQRYYQQDASDTELSEND